MLSDTKISCSWVSSSEILTDGVSKNVKYDPLSAPIFFKGHNLSHFGLFVLGSTHFLQIFGLWVKIENMSFWTRMYRKPTEKKAKGR